MKILLAGGGSGGSVAPLLAVADKIKQTHPKAVFLLVGTKNGPESAMAEKSHLEFAAITTAKFRRYFSWQNFLTPFVLGKSFFEALKILKSFRPDCVFGAGSFVEVPLVWAAWFLRVPSVIHQQDIAPSLSNKLCQLPASKITVSFPELLTAFSGSLGVFYHRHEDKVVFTGNPFREELKSGEKTRALRKFKLADDRPVLFVVGGGTGAEFFNNLIAKSLPKLIKTVNVIHSAGPGKSTAVRTENYYRREFLQGEDLADAYAAADIVMSRAGLSAITELANLKKLSIIVPMPDSHQEINAAYLLSKQAALVLGQWKITPNNFINLFRKLIFAQDLKLELEENIGKLAIKNAGQKIADIVVNLAEKKSL